jgi:hypothetical protein
MSNHASILTHLTNIWGGCAIEKSFEEQNSSPRSGELLTYLD